MKHPFLALLAAAGPAHGYELKQAFEQRFGAALPPLNAGQVYTTLARLERDGLVLGTEVPDDSRQKRVYELTPAGRTSLEEWITTPTPGTKLRDEFFLKLVFADSGGIDSGSAVIERQRRATLQALRDLTSVAGNGTEAAALLADGAALHLEADLKWLELCEQRLNRKDTR
jgi:DNA-binding PadR family transcriptional regulator